MKILFPQIFRGKSLKRGIERKNMFKNFFLIIVSFLLLCDLYVIAQVEPKFALCNLQNNIKDCLKNDEYFDDDCVWCNLTNTCLYRCHDRKEVEMCYLNITYGKHTKSCDQRRNESWKAIEIVILVLMIILITGFMLFCLWKYTIYLIRERNVKADYVPVSS